jgi:predicted ABC-type ATPase
MLFEMRKLIARGTSFALETTCSGKSYVKLLQQCRQNGWRITLLYFWLNSPELAVQRVAKRVVLGGHGIPQEVVHRRYYLGIANMLRYYLPLADEAEIYDNSDSDLILVTSQSPDEGLFIQDSERWQQILEAGR